MLAGMGDLPGVYDGKCRLSDAQAVLSALSAPQLHSGQGQLGADEYLLILFDPKPLRKDAGNLGAKKHGAQPVAGTL